MVPRPSPITYFVFGAPELSCAASSICGRGHWVDRGDEDEDEDGDEDG
jgi:hypothetical protein